MEEPGQIRYWELMALVDKIEVGVTGGRCIWTTGITKGIIYSRYNQ